MKQEALVKELSGHLNAVVKMSEPQLLQWHQQMREQYDHDESVSPVEMAYYLSQVQKHPTITVNISDAMSSFREDLARESGNILRILSNTDTTFKTDVTPQRRYTVHEVALILGCTDRAAYSLVELGKLDHVNVAKNAKSRRRFRITSEALRTYLRTLEGRRDFPNVDVERI